MKLRGGVFLLYAAVTLWTALHHEPWRDEADVWLLMRDGGFGRMFAQTAYVGSPVLWYLLVGALVKSGLPYAAMTILNLGLAWAAMLLFLIRAPFPLHVRFLALFAYPFVYEYAVLARPYALLVLLLFAAAATFHDEKPWRFAVCVALLANTTSHGLILAAILGALWWSGGLLSVAQLWPRGDAPYPHVARGFDLRNVGSLASAFLLDVRWEPALLFAAVTLAALAFALRRRVIALVFLVTGIGALLLVYVFVWYGGPRHAGLLLAVAITAAWIGGVRARAFEVLLTISLIWSVFIGAQAIVQETREAYSGSKEMAAVLARTQLPIAAHLPARAEALLPYLPGRRFWYPALGEEGTYMKWDRAYEASWLVPHDVAVARARQHFRGRDWLLLLDRPLDDPAFRLIATNRETIFGARDERYWLYAPVPP